MPARAGWRRARTSPGRARACAWCTISPLPAAPGWSAAGTCAEYDWRADRPHAETDPLAPQSLYGIAKARTGELLCDAGPHLGLTVGWARIFFVYGPGEPPGRLLGDLIAGLRAGREVPCSDGTQRRDFLSAADIGAALVAMLEAGADGPVNVGSGEAVEVRRLIGHVADRIGRPDSGAARRHRPARRRSGPDRRRSGAAAGPRVSPTADAGGGARRRAGADAVSRPDRPELRAELRRFAAFLVVGVVNTGVGYGLFALFLWLGLPPQPALALAFGLGVLWNYGAHARLVFGTSGLRRLPVYAAVYVAIYAGNAMALAWLLDRGIGPLLAQAIILPFAVVASFLGVRAALTGRLPAGAKPPSPRRD